VRESGARVLPVDDLRHPARPASVPSAVEVPSGAYLPVKYAVSRAMGAAALLVCLPLLGMIAVAIRVFIGKGVVYRQVRVGYLGEDFTILKFRTMDEDRRRIDLRVDGDRRHTHKTESDPRHTRLGRFLRRASLDELPQLWNVVNGSMTLIGPRPEIAWVADARGFRHHPRHLVRPGITGLWQVSRHRHELLHENLDIDLEYLATVSAATDLRILRDTIVLAFRPNGK
jgi:lipopolysaccharide/colanic/teichoic acid biosynthesis glycosyltransferase